MKAKDIMVQPVVVVPEDATLEDVARLMLARCIGSVPVVDEQGKLCGIITESDFMAEERYLPFSYYRLPKLFGEWVSEEGIEKIYQASRSITAGEIMSRPVITADEEDSVTAMVERMLRHEVHHLPVVRDAVPVGMVARHDLLRMMAQNTTPG